MFEEENPKTEAEVESKYGLRDYICAPFNWLKMLATKMHWSYVFGVVAVYGICQGVGGSLSHVATAYYMKDVQKVQPSEAQLYHGFTAIPLMVKPIWGLMTDVIPISGYRRRPYLIFAGILGIVSMLFLSLGAQMHIFFAILSLTVGRIGIVIADVTIDACVAQKSRKHHVLAADLQTLCVMSQSIGSLLGFFFAGLLVHLMGPMGVYGLLTIPAALISLAGIILDEPQTVKYSYKEVSQNIFDATRAMWETLKLPEVWRPCLYMYLSIALSLNIYEGMFYWYTDSDTGPHFSQDFVGYTLSVGAIGSMLGAFLYQYALKDRQFRDLCFWSQLFLGLSGMLDLMLVLRWNLKMGISNHLFAVLDECGKQLIGKLKWMPLLVLSAMLSPRGIEGTFFALIMSIDNIGINTASWLGGMLLHFLKVTRTSFDNLWIAILIRNLARICPVFVVFLIPKTDANSSILPPELLGTEETFEAASPDEESIELVSLVTSVNR